MVKPTVIVKNGKRYVKVGTKLARVSDSISERELIQWLVKHLKPKKRKRSKKEPTIKVSTAPMTSTVTTDRDRIDARETKEKLDQKQKELDLLKLSAAVVAGVQQSSGIQQPALPAGVGQAAIMPPIQQALPSGASSSSAAPATPTKIPRPLPTPSAPARPPRPPQYAASAPSPMKIEVEDEIPKHSDKDLARNTKITNFQAAKAKLEADKPINLARRIASAKTFAEMRKIASTHNLGQSANPTAHELVTLIQKAGKNLLGENQITQAIDAEYDPKIQKIEKEIADLTAQMGTGMEESRSNSSDGTGEDQLNRAMSSYPEFLGTIAVNEIHHLEKLARERNASISPHKFCWIMNTEPRSKPGAHWVCFFVDLPRSIDYYDPLADPISVLPGDVLKDVKALVKSLHGEKTYLRFKENLMIREQIIPDQNDTSNNCGEFCVHFLQSRLKGESFAKASGWDAQGEEKIEKWKLQPRQKMWLSGQSGEGLRDITIPPRKGANKIFDRIKATQDLFKSLQKRK